ncbi:RNA 2',3'-cyclic phosphodiesterase [Cellulosimicrobium sp. NPDC057127]|uniref:RNA 2',3'-cyclic phosphodiesterase n=1 Tax=Cellulosimicrobium sp. NPDC057127 TaxID=3346026 RepID=UPI00363BE16E
MRLFAALYPDAAASAHLDLALGGVRAHELLRPDGAPLVRWVPREQWHATVSFFGQVPDGAVPDLTAALAEVATRAAPLELSLRGAGVFDRRVLWVGVGGDTAQLRALSADVGTAAEDVGVHVDRRPRQRAHLTVARAGAGAREAERRAERRARRGREGAPVPSVRDALEAPAAALSVYDGPRWHADTLALVESEVGAARPVHRVVATLALGSPDAGEDHAVGR